MDGIKAIFFDMGNTLLHFHNGKSDEEKDMQGLFYLTQYLNKFSSKITLSEVKLGFFENWMKGIKDRSITLTEYPIEVFLNGFLAKYKLKFSLNQCIEAINLFYSEYREQIYYENDLQDTLRTIKNKGYRIGVISNTCYYDEVMKSCFRKAGIYNFIDSFTFSYSLRIAKPNIQIFTTAIQKMGVTPMEAIMVGDNLISDIKPALSIGMKTVWLNDKKINGSVTPNIQISRLSELLEYI